MKKFGLIGGNDPIHRQIEIEPEPGKIIPETQKKLCFIANRMVKEESGQWQSGAENFI